MACLVRQPRSRDRSALTRQVYIKVTAGFVWLAIPKANSRSRIGPPLPPIHQDVIHLTTTSICSSSLFGSTSTIPFSFLAASWNTSNISSKALAQSKAIPRLGTHLASSLSYYVQYNSFRKATKEIVPTYPLSLGHCNMVIDGIATFRISLISPSSIEFPSRSFRRIANKQQINRVRNKQTNKPSRSHKRYMNTPRFSPDWPINSYKQRITTSTVSDLKYHHVSQCRLMTK